jgi:hypothetical protein
MMTSFGLNFLIFYKGFFLSFTGQGVINSEASEALGLAGGGRLNSTAHGIYSDVTRVRRTSSLGPSVENFA